MCDDMVKKSISYNNFTLPRNINIYLSITTLFLNRDTRERGCNLWCV